MPIPDPGVPTWKSKKQRNLERKADRLIAAKQLLADTEGQGIRVYTDGSAYGTACGRGAAGYGIWAGEDSPLNRAAPLEGTVQTNNRAELTAVIEALRMVPRDSLVQIVSDSSYVVSGVSDWAKGWKDRGWARKGNRALLNVDLWKRLWAVLDERGGDTQWVLAPSHMGIKGNERADEMADRGARMHGRTLIEKEQGAETDAEVVEVGARERVREAGRMEREREGQRVSVEDRESRMRRIIAGAEGGWYGAAWSLRVREYSNILLSSLSVEGTEYLKALSNINMICTQWARLHRGLVRKKVWHLSVQYTAVWDRGRQGLALEYGLAMREIEGRAGILWARELEKTGIHQAFGTGQAALRAWKKRKSAYAQPDPKRIRLSADIIVLTSGMGDQSEDVIPLT